MFELTIHGETPSKKNSRINTRSGRSFPSKRYMEWHDSALAEILTALSRGEAVRIPEGQKVAVSFAFFHGDLKRRDSDNQCSSILDTMIDAGIIPDDNWKVVPVKHIYDFYDKGKPRCVVVVEEI